MTPPITLSIYIARQFAGTVVGMLLALSRSGRSVRLHRTAAPLDLEAGRDLHPGGEIAALRLPYIAMQVLPFAVLLGGMLCFWRLTRSSELSSRAPRACPPGSSSPLPRSARWLFGMLATTAVSPLSSVMFDRAEAMDNAYLKSGGGPLALTGGQLWLRQSDHALSPQGVAILHALWRGAARQAADGVAGQRVPSGWPRPAAQPDRGRRGDPRRRRMAVAERARHSAGADAGTAGHDQSADRPHRGTRAGELRLARYAVVLGACPTSSRCWTARDFRRSATGCISRRCSPCRCSARPWRWSAPDSPCVRRGAAAWRR